MKAEIQGGCCAAEPPYDPDIKRGLWLLDDFFPLCKKALCTIFKHILNFSLYNFT